MIEELDRLEKDQQVENAMTQCHAGQKTSRRFTVATTSLLDILSHFTTPAVAFILKCYKPVIVICPSGFYIDC